MDGADVAGEQAQRATGVDGGELGRVADQAQQRPSVLDVAQQGVQVGGAGHPGLVQQHHITGAQRPERAIRRCAGQLGARGVVQVLVQVLRRPAQILT